MLFLCLISLLPEHITADYENELIIEEGFGSILSIRDKEYQVKGCRIETRENIFRECDVIFCLKLLQPSYKPCSIIQ